MPRGNFFSLSRHSRRASLTTPQPATDLNLPEAPRNQQIDIPFRGVYDNVVPQDVEPDPNHLNPDDISDGRSSHGRSPSLRGRDSTINQRSTSHVRSRSSSIHQSAIRLPGIGSAASTPDTTRLKRGEVLCNLSIKYFSRKNDVSQVLSIEDIVITYEEDTVFEELNHTAIDKLNKQVKKAWKSFYLKVGRYRLERFDTHKVISRGILETNTDWNEYLPMKIAEVVNQNRGTHIIIEIDWEYSSLEIEQVPGQTYAKTIATALEEKTQQNWEGDMYIPNKDLEKMFDKDTIFKLLQEDESLHSAEILTLTGGSRLDTEKLSEDVWLFGARLLAWCIYAGLPLICFYSLWLKGFREANLPLNESDCPIPLYKREFRLAVAISGGFAAHTFDYEETKKPQHIRLSRHHVVPILFDPENPEHFLGEGTFGMVYKVHIDRDHHTFSIFEEETFALKIFRDRSAHAQQNVENEHGTLARLADAPHPNIMTHLGSWNQAGTCYMLFRCADCNLRTYLQREPPEWTKKNLIDLVTQMKDLADGLRRIHNLGPSGLRPDFIGELPRLRQRHLSQTCFHHDLKPANILVTINPDTGALLFQISDFGSAKIGQVLSGMKYSPWTAARLPGDVDYGAPDAYLENRTSRPYDLWSMGCIFLELLTWILIREKDSVKNFADRRLELIEDAKNSNQDQAFWYMNNRDQIYLKPAVVQQLKILKEASGEKGIFPLLVHVVSKLLTPRPRERPDAAKLYNDLDAICLQLYDDLKTEDFYLNDEIPSQTRIAAPPSSIGDPDEFSRRPSIDERPVLVRFGDQLPIPQNPHSTSHRRSTLGSDHASNRERIATEHSRSRSVPTLNTQLETSREQNTQDWVNQHLSTPNTPTISRTSLNGVAEILHHGRGEDSPSPASIPPFNLTDGQLSDAFETSEQY